MKLLAIEREVADVPEESLTGELLEAEARTVWKLYQFGILREIYFSSKHKAVLMLECDGPESARLCLDRLPLVRARLIDFEIIPLTPYTGYARLFAREEKT